MRVLVDCGNYFSDNDNLGDRAIFQIVRRRLIELWPAAQMTWITLDPPLMERTCPGVRTLLLQSRHHWQMFDHAGPTAPGPRGSDGLLSLEQLLARSSHVAQEVPGISEFLRAVSWAELVVAAMGGAFSDGFPEHARGILDTLEIAQALGKPTALLTCGLEFVTERSLVAKALAVLPHVSLIACRERLAGPHVLASLGVPDDQVAVSGDDAVELAYEARQAGLGSGLGVNLRSAAYAGETSDAVAVIRLVLHAFACRYRVPLVAVPISLFNPSDLDGIRRLIEGCELGSLEGRWDTPEAVMGQAGRCRVVVTGSYHAAVFALSQGISAVALAGSRHYRTKLHGLSAQFGPGCRVVDLHQADLRARLMAAIEDAWWAADAMRPLLLAAARRQIDAGRAAYRRLAAAVAQSLPTDDHLACQSFSTVPNPCV